MPDLDNHMVCTPDPQPPRGEPDPDATIANDDPNWLRTIALLAGGPDPDSVCNDQPGRFLAALEDWRDDEVDAALSATVVPAQPPKARALPVLQVEIDGSVADAALAECLWAGGFVLAYRPGKPALLKLRTPFQRTPR